MLTDTHIDLLWMKMANMYGHKWVSSFGESDDGTWLNELSDITPAQMESGIKECLKREDDWPPTLPEFRKLAKPIVPAYHQPLGRLPAPEIDRDAAAREIEKMRNPEKKVRYKGNAFLPGESLGDYLDAQRKSGMSPEEFMNHRTRIEE